MATADDHAASPSDRRVALLGQAARALHGEPDPERALAFAADAAGELAESAFAAVCVLRRDGSPLWAHRPGSAGVFASVGDPRSFPPSAQAIAQATVVCVDDTNAASPVAGRSRRAGEAVLPVAAVVVVPIPSVEGAVEGVVFAARPEPGPFTAQQVDALVALAAHIGVAIGNLEVSTRLAELQARGKEIVYRLQEAVRPPAPSVPFSELGVHYVAADPGAPTGGDLYDWITLAGGDVHLAVVDVMGKGVEATQHALAVTHALRLLVVKGCPLGEVVREADALVGAQNPELVATVLVARYEPAAGRVVLAGAGHPPAILVTGDGVREVAAPGIPIGWPGAGSQTEVELMLDRSDTLVLYTDGLIEASKDIVRGLDEIARSAASLATYPASSMARLLVERQLAGATRNDDSLALVLRRRVPPPPVHTRLIGPLVHRFSPSWAAVPVARHFLLDWLAQVPVEARVADELALVASELCANAVRQAVDGPGGVVLRSYIEGDAVVIEVQDDAPTPVPLELPPDDEVPDVDAERGRGLFLVRSFVDEIASQVDDHGTVVRVTKRAVVGDPAAAHGQVAPLAAPRPAEASARP